MAGKNYAVEGMHVKCSMGETMCTLNTIGHGVTYQVKSVLNANDHIPMVNITTFGVCTCTGAPCVPVTPLAWRFCNEEHMIDGAAALTTDSLCNCALGGVISIVDNSVSMGSIGAQGIKAEYVHNECSFVDKAKDTVFGKESAYDAERFEKAGIKAAFDELPRDRREAVYETFENAPVEIKRIVNSLSCDLSVENTIGNDCCHYDPMTKKIRMESNMDNAEYAEVFSHEYGHFVDNKKGDVSDTYEFREAMSKDLANYDRSTDVGRQNFDKMMNDLMSSDAAFDRAVSDNMSAYFKNDPEVIKRYSDEGIDYYQHDNSYWSEHGNREAEIYANSFSIATQDNKSSCEFMQQHFPHTWEQFKKTL